jgi:hypothetical protein
LVELCDNPVTMNANALEYHIPFTQIVSVVTGSVTLAG